MKRTMAALLAALCLGALWTRAAADEAADTLVISLLGDCSIGDAYQSRYIASSFTQVTAQNGFDWPFSTISAYLKSDDLTLANLEVSLTDRKPQTRKKFSLIAPASHVEVLLQGGVDAVNTVNNHCLDYGREGYRDTLQALDDAGIGSFGTLYPDTDREIGRVLVRTVKGVRIGMIGFSYPKWADVEHARKRIEALREQGCQLVIVSMHWGRELHAQPELGQRTIGKGLIDAGADVVYGHHPHVIEPIQVYKGKPIFYSTGNFIFGTMGRADPDTGIFQLIYRLDGGVALDTLRVIPLRTRGMGDFRPYELIGAAERTALFTKLQKIRQKLEGVQNLPDSFLETGVARFENGALVE
jgi:poly-gamma-glutamate synthesis protein (capsule biosynthesis protein)